MSVAQSQRSPAVRERRILTLCTHTAPTGECVECSACNAARHWLNNSTTVPFRDCLRKSPPYHSTRPIRRHFCEIVVEALASPPESSGDDQFGPSLIVRHRDLLMVEPGCVAEEIPCQRSLCIACRSPTSVGTKTFTLPTFWPCLRISTILFPNTYNDQRKHAVRQIL